MQENTKIAVGFYIWIALDNLFVGFLWEILKPSVNGLSLDFISVF